LSYKTQSSGIRIDKEKLQEIGLISNIFFFEFIVLIIIKKNKKKPLEFIKTNLLIHLV
jgi:hypothetical protein